jgi:hypothetical protein
MQQPKVTFTIATAVFVAVTGPAVVSVAPRGVSGSFSAGVSGIVLAASVAPAGDSGSLSASTPGGDTGSELAAFVVPA